MDAAIRHSLRAGLMAVGYTMCAQAAWARRGPTRSCDVCVALHVLAFPPVFVLSYAVGYGTPSYL